MRLAPLQIALVAVVLVAGETSASDDELRSSVVRIEVVKLVTRQTSGGDLRTKPESWTGSGFWVAGTNRIITCAHVLDGARKVSIHSYSPSPGQEPWSTDKAQVSLCLSDPAHDIAILQVPDVGPGLSLASSTQVSGREIRSVGHTENYPWRINYGQLTGVVPAQLLGIPLKDSVLVCDVSFGPGSSGGIVVDRENRILGMIEGGKEGGKYGTRIAVPAPAIKQALRSLIPGHPCQVAALMNGAPIRADENTFADLIQGTIGRSSESPALVWGQISYGVLTGVDRFDDPVSVLRVDIARSTANARSWSLNVEAARRTVDRKVESGTEEVTDTAGFRRLWVSFGGRLPVKEFGRISLYSAARVGYVRDRITHDYAFASPLFAPQSYERAVSGALGGLGLDADVQVVTNLRIAWSGEIWQGSGGIGNGVTNRVGVRFGVGGHAQ